MQARPKDVDAIRRQMAQIRRKHHEDVREVLADAERVVGWGRHWRPYVWAALGTATATAFWIVTKRDRTAPAGRVASSDVAEVQQGIAEGVAQDSDGPKTRQSLWGDAWNLIVPVVVRAAQNYVAHSLEQWIAQQRMTAARGEVPSPSDGELERPKGRSVRPERESYTTGEGPGSNLVTGVFNDDRSCS